MIRKVSASIAYADGTADPSSPVPTDFGAAYGIVRCVDVTVTGDTSTSIAIADADGKTVATIASSDYTTLTRFYLSPEEAYVYDTAGEAMTANGDASIGVVARSPLIITASGLDTGDSAVVDVFVEI
jgi:hypothetical protein